MHPYDGNKGKSLVEDATIHDVTAHKRVAGLVQGAGWDGDDNNALVAFTLRDNPGETTKTGFAQVTSGLEILQDLANSDGRDNVKVVDCGIVLF